jgi:outer membrane protein assembly factor BamB
MKKKLISAITILLMTFATSIYAQDWPQFLGPERNSTSTQKNLLRSWPSEGPEVLWATDLGIGFGGPVIKDGKAYLLDRDDKYGDYMRCFDMESGKELWKYGYEAPGSVEFPGSRSVPAVDDKHVYSCGPNGDLYCFDIITHQPFWHVNIWTDFGGKPASLGGGGFGQPGNFPMWAIAQCPVIYGDLLIIASQAPQAGVVAYNKLTGKVVWKTSSLGNLGYVSPSIAKISGKDQVIMVTASKGGFGGESTEPSNVVGIDPRNGDVLWTYSNWSCWIPASSAYDAGQNKLLIIGGYRAGAAMIQIEKNQDKFSIKELFKTADFGEHTKPPLYYQGCFYAQFTNNDRRDGLVCMREDGKIMWKTMRAPVFDKGSMILVNDLIIATDGQTKLYLIKPDSTGFKPIASANLLKESKISGNERIISIVGSNQNWAPMALADGKLLIRGQHQMLCVKVVK